VAHAADLGTTLYGLQHGLREGNPAYGWTQEQPALITAQKVSSAAVTIALTRWLYARNPKVGLVMGLGQLAVLSYVVVHNVRELRRLP